jgi:hypothetical protein
MQPHGSTVSVPERFDRLPDALNRSRQLTHDEPCLQAEHMIAQPAKLPVPAIAAPGLSEYTEPSTSTISRIDGARKSAMKPPTTTSRRKQTPSARARSVRGGGIQVGAHRSAGPRARPDGSVCSYNLPGYPLPKPC